MKITFIEMGNFGLKGKKHSGKKGSLGILVCTCVVRMTCVVDGIS